jgi:hypothetical protein
MSAKIKNNYGPYFNLLSPPEQRAAEKYIRKMAKLYPRLARKATAGPGNEGTVYIYIPRPSDEDEDLKIHWKMAKVSLDVLLDTGVDIVLMPA